jgi:hypothetical protein
VVLPLGNPSQRRGLAGPASVATIIKPGFLDCTEFSSPTKFLSFSLKTLLSSVPKLDSPGRSNWHLLPEAVAVSSQGNGQSGSPRPGAVASSMPSWMRRFTRSGTARESCHSAKRGTAYSSYPESTAYAVGKNPVS